MKVRINIDKSVALDAGRDQHGLAVVDVPAAKFTAAEREVLKQLTDARYPDKPEADFYLDAGPAEARRVAAEPTEDAVHAILARIAEVTAAAKTKAEANEREKAAREDRDVAEYVATMNRLDAMPDEELVVDHGNGAWTSRQVPTWGYYWSQERPEHEATRPIRDRVAARMKARTDRIAADNKARVAAEKARAEADRLAWIDAHGSDHLKKACRAGYNCQRKYVTERAALEFPGFVVDFDDNANWSERTCPSEEALDILATLPADAAGEIVWLTASVEPTDDEDADSEEDCWAAREAIVIREYLGKYDLVRDV